MRIDKQLHERRLKMTQFKAQVLTLAQAEDLDDDELICALIDISNSVLQRQLTARWYTRPCE